MRLESIVQKVLWEYEISKQSSESAGENEIRKQGAVSAVRMRD